MTQTSQLGLVMQNGRGPTLRSLVALARNRVLELKSISVPLVSLAQPSSSSNGTVGHDKKGHTLTNTVVTLRKAAMATVPLTRSRGSVEEIRGAARADRGGKVAAAEGQIVNYSPTVVVHSDESSGGLEQRILRIMSEHAYELSDLLRREAAKQNRSSF
ncbi:MAG TPA: hypothetical protein VKS22_02010 [Candidatus Binataceae bacterium]|nr:hypothetical protein [Candidatus Binataceae bacterium]